VSDQPTQKELTPKQRKYVKGVVEGKSKKQAALDAGYTESMAQKPKDKIETPAVKAAFTELLEQAGVTDELLAQRIFEGLNAMESKFWQPRGVVAVKDAEGNEALSVDGSELIRRDLVSFSERRAMVEVILKLTGKMVEKHEHKFTLEDLLGESHE